MTIEKAKSESEEKNMEFYLCRITTEHIKAGILKNSSLLEIAGSRK